MPEQPRSRLLFTIDVEEDMPGWQIQQPLSVSNVQALRRLHELCAGIGVQPTYLCTYPVVDRPESAEVISDLHQLGGCEIGTHLHPWNCPPFQGVPGHPGVDEQTIPYYQYELGAELFRPKLETLHHRITELTGQEPVSFRAGRFGIDAATLAELIPFGYEVDSSVTPLEEHLDDGGPDFRSAPQHPYRPHRDDISRKGDMEIVEIPVSVALTHRLPRMFARAYVHIPKKMRLRGLLSRDFLSLVDFAWLYPARFDLDLMSRAARVLHLQGSPIQNVFIHSSELVPNASGRIRTEDDVEQCFERIRGILEYCMGELGSVPATLGEAGRALRAPLGLKDVPVQG